MSTVTTINLEDIKEIMHTTIRLGGKPESGEAAELPIFLGSSVEFEAELYDADGTQIGTAKGTSVIFAEADGTVMQIVSAFDDYTDGGRVTWSGAYTMFPTDEPKSVPAQGVSGRYRGLSGTRTFQLLERPDPGTSLVRSSLVLNG
nr:Chain A, PloI4 [Micromonospora sp.]7X81_B Chain B, PloI4 [Micromonospora sp.]